MAHIRPLCRADAAALGRVEAAAWRQAYDAMLPAHSIAGLKPERLARRWSQRLNGPSHGLWGLVDDDLLVGYATAALGRDPDLDPGFAGELLELYIHPGWQGRGLGGRLLEHTWEQLGSGGIRWGVLWVLTENWPARAFYEAHGLQADGRHRFQSVVGGRVSVTRYARALQPLDLDLVLAGDRS